MLENFFGQTDVQDILNTFTMAGNQKAAAAKQTAIVAERESGEIADAATDYNEDALKTLDQLQIIEQQGEKARAMADSGNIIDRISLIGDQLLSPQEYTREGRMARASELSQTLALRGQIHNVNVTAAQARIDEAGAAEKLATADVDAGLLKTKMLIDGLQMSAAGIQAAETLRANNLTQLDMVTLDKALIGPVAAGGRVIINGMGYTRTELRERRNSLETREKLSMLTPQAADPEFAQKLSIQHDLVLANYTLPELQKLRENNYILDDGTQVLPSVWDAHYNRQLKLQSDSIELKVTENTLRNQVPTMLTEATQMLNNGAKFISPGTPASTAKAEYQAAISSVAILATEDQTPAGKLVAVKEMQRAQERYVGQIQKEAVRKAGGDKDLASIYSSQMLGEPIQPAMVQDVVVQRYKKGKGFGDFLNKDTSVRLKKYADSTYQDLLKQSAQEAMNPMSGVKRTDADLKEEAITQAFDKVANDSGITAVNQITQAGVFRKDNPAVTSGKMNPAGILDLQRRASITATDNVMHANELESDQIQAIRAGRFNDSGLSPDKASTIAVQLNAETVAVEYEMYEAQKPGLGYEVQQWYATQLPELARNYTANLDPLTQALTGDAVLVEAQNFNDMWTQIDEVSVNRGKQAAMEASVGAKRAENMYPVLLNMNKDLSDSQKQSVFYDIITPAIQQARALGASEEQVTAAAFDAITNFKSNDPILMSGLKAFQRSLPSSMDDFSAMWQFMLYKSTYRDRPKQQGGGVYDPSDGMYAAKRQAKLAQTNPSLATNAIQSIIPWMKAD